MLLPIHPRPYHDEILSSWLVRIAMANYYNAHTFYRHLLGVNQNIWNRDIDKLASDSLFEQLSHYVGIPAESIKHLSLSNFEGRLYERLNQSGNNPWLLPLGIYHRKRQIPGIQYCPTCLTKDSIVYFRKNWRLSFFTICPIHLKAMRNNCPHCGAPVSYHRNVIGRSKADCIPLRSMKFCYKCDQSLCELNAQDNLCSLSKYLEDYTRLIAMLDGNVTPNIHIGHKLLFFQGLWILTAAILGRRGEEVRANISKETRISIHKSSSIFSFNNLELHERLKTSCVLAWLISSWPENLIKITHNTHFSLSAFTDYKGRIPYWIDKIVETNFNHSVYTPSIKEIESCAEYLRTGNRKCSALNISSTMGIGVEFVRKSMKYLKNISD